MLNRWTLENFKPIRGSLDLPLKNVTVLAGLNSSGKSSVLQSILLISQTLANQILDKPLVLNGNSVQLGIFEGVRNKRAEEAYIRIGFELSYQDSFSRPKVRERIRARYPYFDIDDTIKSINVSATFVGVSQHPNGTAGIEAVRVAIVDACIGVTNEWPAPDSDQIRQYSWRPTEDTPLPDTVVARVQSLSDREKAEFLQGVGKQFMRLVPYSEGENYAAELCADDAAIYSRQVLLARLTHFLPNRFIHKFNLEERQRQEIADVVEYLLLSEPQRGVPPAYYMRGIGIQADTFEQVQLHEVSEDLRSAIDIIIDKESGVEPFGGSTVGELLQWARSAPLRGRAKSKFIGNIRHAIESHLIGEIRSIDETDAGTGLEVLSGDFNTEAIDAACRRVTNFFTGMIRYLGPLRADPQAAQGFAPSSEPDDVGSRGQYAAAVYDANRKQQINWWNPKTGRVAKNTLEEAIDEWVRYLGVAHHVTTREAGLSGVSWMIQHVLGDEDRPLAAVGVGVSQVLPILVSGLLAPIGALMLIEQPELHLHARAQARLGDFFLGLSRVGKQCIIETHSECLVNQLRYYIVKDGLSTREATAIYFVEQDERGDARFVPIEISAAGNIVNWPEGFFDESLHQEDRITREVVLARSDRTPDA